MLKSATAALFAAGTLLVSASPALAVDCDDLQQAVNQAGTGPSTVEITEASCPDLHITVPAEEDITITGQPTGTVVDGNGTDPIFSVSGAAYTVTLQNLDFDGTGIGAGVPAVRGAPANTGTQRLEIVDSTFTAFPTGSTAISSGLPLVVDNTGFGDVYNAIETTNPQPTDPSLELTDSAFVDVANVAVLGNGRGPSRLAGNVFETNKSAAVLNIDGAVFEDQDYALGLYDNEFTGSTDSAVVVTGQAGFSNPLVDQAGNYFHDNVITPDAAAYGAAERLSRVQVKSLSDIYFRNAIEDLPQGSPAATGGGAIAIRDCDQNESFTAYNLLALENSVGRGGKGGGIFTSCQGALAGFLENVTISRNVAPPGQGGGMATTTGDRVMIWSTIDTKNTGGDLVGHALQTSDVVASDVCSNDPIVTEINMCLDPLLTDDGQQTAKSPTIERGGNFFEPERPATDVFGKPRLFGRVVDIGADEFQGSAQGAQFPPGDTTAPTVSGAKFSRKRFRVGSATTPIAAAVLKRRKAPRGTVLSYRLAEPSSVELLIDRKLKGRKVLRKGKATCVAPTRGNAKRRRCTRYKRAGRLTRLGPAGTNKVAFSGRIGRRKLKPGNYRITIQAHDLASNFGKRTRLPFTIVR
jgi:hypothetical protein